MTTVTPQRKLKIHSKTASANKASSDTSSHTSTPQSTSSASQDTSQNIPDKTSTLSTRASVVSKEKERYGGVKIGSAFFGWLAATGLSVILIALLSAAGAAVASSNADAVSGASTSDITSASLIGAAVLLVTLFISYYCGGYVAGRMARFDGVKQGFAVWLWAVVISVVVAVTALIAGSQFNIVNTLNLPAIPISGSDLTTGGVLTLLAVAIFTLAGAVLGGKAGMHFHRKVDREGLGR